MLWRVVTSEKQKPSCLKIVHKIDGKEKQWRSQNSQLGGAQKWARLRACEIFYKSHPFSIKIRALEPRC